MKTRVWGQATSVRRPREASSHAGEAILAAIVPTVLFPPGTSFTLQVTPVSLVFATPAVNVSEFPRSTLLLVVVTVTSMGGVGAGTGVTTPAPPPPQPSAHALAVRSVGKHHFREIAFVPFAGARASRAFAWLSPILCRRRGCISAAIAGEGPAKSPVRPVRMLRLCGVENPCI